MVSPEVSRYLSFSPNLCRTFNTGSIRDSVFSFISIVLIPSALAKSSPGWSFSSTDHRSWQRWRVFNNQYDNAGRCCNSVYGISFINSERLLINATVRSQTYSLLACAAAHHAWHHFHENWTSTDQRDISIATVFVVGLCCCSHCMATFSHVCKVWYNLPSEWIEPPWVLERPR